MNYPLMLYLREGRCVSCGTSLGLDDDTGQCYTCKMVVHRWCMAIDLVCDGCVREDQET